MHNLNAPERGTLEYLAYPVIGALPHSVSQGMVGRENAIVASRANFVLEFAVSAVTIAAYSQLSENPNLIDISPVLAYIGATLMRLDQLLGHKNYQPDSSFNAHPIGSPLGTLLYGGFDFFRKAKNIATSLI